MKPEIFIRADGNSQIGLGHVIRCSALADMLREDFSCTFLIQNPSEFLINEIKNAGANYINIPETQNYITEAKELAEKYIIKQDIVVLDGYNFETEYQKQIKATSAKLICIDDLHDKEFYADIIINHSPAANPKHYKAQPYTQLALGLDYALLRPAFIEQAGKDRKVEKVETVFVCFGGSDYKNLTIKTLKSLMEFNNLKKIIVVTGPSYNSSDSLNHLANKDKRIVVYNAVDEKKMLSLMLESDLAIIPTSGTLIEAICCGCVLLTCYYAENQKEFHNFLVNEVGIKSFGDSTIAFQTKCFKSALLQILTEEKFAGNPLQKHIMKSSTNILNLIHSLL